MSTTTKENRIVHEVVVPHSPAPELKICYEVINNGPTYRVWIDGNPGIWEVDSRLNAAIGALVQRLENTELREYHYYQAIEDRDKKRNY